MRFDRDERGTCIGMMLLTGLAVLAIVGVAAYCMVCERLAETHATSPPTPGEKVGAAARADALI